MLLENSSVIDIDRHTRSMLPRVSRTFALGIKLLPSRLESPVRLGYLLCRIADTVEDDLALAPGRKAELLDELLPCFDDPQRADAFGDAIHELTTQDDYVDLVAATGEVFTLYRKLDARTQAILRRWIEEMVRGMRGFVVIHPHGIRIADVAGIPRVLLLRRRHGRASAHRPLAPPFERRRRARVRAGCSKTASRSARRCSR